MAADDDAHRKGPGQTMNKLHEGRVEGRPYFHAGYSPDRPDASRFQERTAITEAQVAALELARAGELERAAELYDAAALRWEALGGYSDHASDARAAARKLRRVTP